jgi:3-hydroxyisobutyrate dehydrogenase
MASPKPGQGRGVHLLGDHGSRCGAAAGKQLEATGRHYLDAPISGGAQRAAQGELTILALRAVPPRSPRRAGARCDGGKALRARRCGRPGRAFKMINQLLAGVHIAAASEAITFAAKQGLDIKQGL